MKEIRRITMTDDQGREWARQRKEYESTADLLELATYAAIYDNRDDLEATKEFYTMGLYLVEAALRNIRYMSEAEGREALEHLQAWRNGLECCDWDEWEEDEDESI